MQTMKCSPYSVMLGEGRALLRFYEETFGAKILFHITNEQLQEKMAPTYSFPPEQRQWLAHAILAIGGIEWQISDMPLLPQDASNSADKLSLSFMLDSCVQAECLQQKFLNHPQSAQVVPATANEFAEFYSILKDPFGNCVQLTVEREPDVSKKGENNRANS